MEAEYKEPEKFGKNYPDSKRKSLIKKAANAKKSGLTKPKVFKCEICGWETTKKNGLAIHMGQKHKEESFEPEPEISNKIKNDFEESKEVKEFKQHFEADFDSINKMEFTRDVLNGPVRMFYDDNNTWEPTLNLSLLRMMNPNQLVFVKREIEEIMNQKRVNRQIAS